MRLNWFIAAFAVLGWLAGCSPKSPNTTAITPPGTNVMASAKPDDLLLRVRFAGTAAMMADTNAAYLTNFASLPETTALGKRIAEKMAGLPGRLAARTAQGLTNGTAAVLTPVFTDLLERGFVLELRGDSNGVRQMTLAAKGSSDEEQRWSQAYHQAAQDWFGSTYQPTNTPTPQPIGNEERSIWMTNGWLVWQPSSAGKDDPQRSSNPSSTSEVPDETFWRSLTEASDAMLEIEMTSSLLPNPIQRSLYGGFSRFKFSAVPAEQSFKIRGTAVYEHNLPLLTNKYALPAKLIHEPLVSFTVVCNPSAWLAEDSPLRSMLPKTSPETIYFWGQGQLPGQFYALMPFNSEDRFLNGYGAELVDQLTHLSTGLDVGKVSVDTNSPAIRWKGIPFLTPEITTTNDGSSQFVRAGLFPDSGLTNCLPQPFVNQVTGRTNLVLYDWEVTGPRLFGWLYIGQLGLMLSNHAQLGTATPSAQWILAAQKAFGNGNTITEITQTGPQELAFARRAPLGLTSLEIFWLANWLESSNFPAANFLMPMPKP